MKTLTVRLPAALVADLETESHERHCSKSDIVRERLSLAGRSRVRAAPTEIADLVGSVDGLPADLSGRKKAYLTKTGYGHKHPLRGHVQEISGSGRTRSACWPR